MKKPITVVALFCAAIALVSVRSTAAQADVELVKNGDARVAIYVEPEIMAADKPVSPNGPFVERDAETQRRRLRESVHDLARYLNKMSGATVKVLQHAPAPGDRLTPILIGRYARQRFGEPGQKSPFKQGFRVSVTRQAIGLQGESNEATSYAIYEVLDRLGCRWFMPGELGEYVPQAKTLRLQEGDVSDAPDTEYRGIWYADDAFKRRNRLGGFQVSAGHALERYITEEQRKEHPEWRAIINGKPHPVRLKWSNPEVSDAVADAIIARLDKDYQPSVSLSPDDGAEFDESDDKKLDAGDWDPSMNQVSLTDRYINFCNRVAERVTKKYPDVRFGFLAYVQYTRPPVREKLHPNLVPQIAPITYCRAHAMTDTVLCPSRPQLRAIVEGWGKAAPGRVSYYNYMYHLAEVAVPYPMIHQMSAELPILYRNGVTFWQPETMSNFDSVLPGMWLTMRLAWNHQLQPQQVLDELFTKFYGSASTPMRRYWQIFDDAWTNVPEHAGSGFGYLRRFTPEVLTQARAAMNEALAAARTPLEYRRVKLFDDALLQFERFMQLRHDLAEGRLTNIDLRADEWFGTQIGLGNEYSENYAFTKVPWSPRTIAGTYFKAFFDAAYQDAGRLFGPRSKYALLGSTPLRQWKYMVADKQDGEALGWQKSDFDDAAWKTTDTAVDTWYALGLENYYGTVWYRQQVKVPPVPAGKKVFLWISSTDGTAKVYVNGEHVPYVTDKGEQVELASGYAEPFSFDITAAVQANANNEIAIETTRPFLNELGTGGLLGPLYLYREK